MINWSILNFQELIWAKIDSSQAALDQKWLGMLHQKEPEKRL